MEFGNLLSAHIQPVLGESINDYIQPVLGESINPCPAEQIKMPHLFLIFSQSD